VFVLVKCKHFEDKSTSTKEHVFAVYTYFEICAYLLAFVK